MTTRHEGEVTKADLLPATLSLKLRKPLKTDDGMIIDVLELREPTLDEVDQMSKNSNKFGAIQAIKNLISAMTGVPPVVLGEMGARDFNQAERYLNGFFDDSPADGTM